MLTMRELMGEGFSDQKATPEARKWNERETLEDWRTAWAAIQNRELERLGIAAKVDSRSFDAQGIDREPSQHEGPAVTAKRRRGELSEIEQENDRRASANDNTADLHAELLKVRSELARIRTRQHDLAAEKEAELSAEHDLSTLALKQRQEREQRDLETYLVDHYAPHLKTVQAEAERVTDRLENAGTVRRLFRDMTGRSRADRERLDKLQATIEAEEDVLAYMTFPSQHRVKLHSTNPLERLNKEVKRRADVVGIFPNEDSIVRLIGAVLLEQNDEWLLQHRYMQIEGMVELDAPAETHQSLIAEADAA
jgi:hypothetical protein